eukprot:GFUD01030914.1.p1 GENE.GFUD01030914.1~~GFUD01030914.1.p1  ORF type:complete len:271 (+),score=68.59 GFUD01030914.1:49-861(+)
MAYHLASSQGEHLHLLRSVVETARQQEQDVFLVSREGHRVFTHRFLLSLYSSRWKELTADLPPQTVIGVNIPVSFGSLLNLVKILTHGEVESENHDDLLEVKIAASLVGIEMINFSLASTDSGKEYHCDSFDFNNSEHSEIADNAGNIGIKEEVFDTDGDSGLDKTAEEAKKRKRGPKRNLNLKCNDCEKTFSERGNFNRHALTHSGIKKFWCDDCEMRFSRKDKLKQHVTLIHSVTGGEAHVCDQCDTKFTRKDHLSRHKSRTHGMLVL